MHTLPITSDQFEHILRACERVLIDSSIPADELRFYLVLRLTARHPGVARTLVQLDEDQLESLSQEILQAMYADRN